MSQALAITPTNTRAGSVEPVRVKTRYTKSIDSTGWLRVRLEPSGEFAFLCEYVKIALVDEGARTHFLILEGEYKNRKASLSQENSAKCLVAATRGSGAKIVATTIGRKVVASMPRKGEKRNQLLANLSFAGKSALITLDSEVLFVETNPLSPDKGKEKLSKPLPKGTYKILAPQSAKDARYTGFYVNGPGGNPDLKYHTVWFPIEYAPTQNSNFVHVGNLSEGCVTMYDLTMWNPLYLYLISNRLDKEGKYVGTVTIS
jgi:hypothetical protein